MTMNLPRGKEVDPGQRCPLDNKSSCEREVKLAPGQSLPRGSSLSRVDVNRPLMNKFIHIQICLMNKFIRIQICLMINSNIRIQICINGSRQVNVFVIFPRNKKGEAISINWFREKRTPAFG